MYIYAIKHAVFDESNAWSSLTDGPGPLVPLGFATPKENVLATQCFATLGANDVG